MAILLLFSFLAGFVIILASCIWPLLSIVLSASSGAGKRRSLGIIFGIMTIFALSTSQPAMSDELADLGPAADIVGISSWLNSAPLSLADLKGKVVLVDFWTYSCINCVRTLPHLTAWYERYKDNGFVIIGVHRPEFDFEKDTKNVQKAIKKFKIFYPVAQDNNSSTWKNYKNRYWPAKYLIDAKGRLRLTHFGEGKYDEMESAIRQLLIENGQDLSNEWSKKEDQTPKYKRTPETYLGAGRMERFVSVEGKQTGKLTFTKPAEIPLHHFMYEGLWEVSKESAKAYQGAALEFNFKADKVFLVIRPVIEGEIRIFIDGKPVDNSIAGVDVKDGKVLLNEERLYHLIDLKGNSENHLLRLEFEVDGIAVYAFTFG